MQAKPERNAYTALFSGFFIFNTQLTMPAGSGSKEKQHGI
ncbi:hypothetical protein CSC17_4957 [Klebsiella oxytoca]|jgi:hypothetical protein|nr:hypothetical protein CSC17_4957 [Klebsiella oxytoca]